MRPGGKKSEAWNYFKKTQDNKIVTCNLCKKNLKFFGNTTNLNLHLKRIHPTQTLKNQRTLSNDCDDPVEISTNIEEQDFITTRTASSQNSTTSIRMKVDVSPAKGRRQRQLRLFGANDTGDMRQNIDFQKRPKQKQQQQQFADVPDPETDRVEAGDSDGFVQDDTCDTRQSVELQQQPEQQQQQQFTDVTDNEAGPVESGNSDGFGHNVGATFISSSNGEQQCYLKWKFHQNNQQAMFSKLLGKESFCDVTIACEEKILRAHKLMLSTSSSYFEMILSRYGDHNPIIILKDVRYDDMSALLQFIYKGEVNIEQSQLPSLLETADMLKVRGLSEICGETRHLENPLQAMNFKAEEEKNASSTFATTKTVQETKKTRTTSILEESFNRQGQPSSPIEAVDLFKTEEMSDICGEARRLEDPMQTMDIKIEEEEDASAIFEPAKTVQQRRRSVPVPEEAFHIPLKIPRQSTNTEITQNVPAAASQSSPSSNPSSSAGSSVHIEGVIRLPEFLIGHGSYHSFWKKPWVVRALKAVSDREMTIRDCSDLLGVGYDILYSRYRRIHRSLKEASVDLPGPSQDSAFRLLRTATVHDQEGNIIVRRDQLPPTTAILSVVDHSERPANTSERENTTEPIVTVKMEPCSSLSDQFESEIMKDNVDVHNMDKCIEIRNSFFYTDNP